MCYFTLQEVVERITKLFKIINSDAFFPLKEWPLALRLVEVITLLDQHGFYARVVSINNVLLHYTGGCKKKNEAIQDNQRRCFLSFERVAAVPETLLLDQTSFR